MFGGCVVVMFGSEVASVKWKLLMLEAQWCAVWLVVEPRAE